MADGVVHYESEHYGYWNLPIDDLLIFGERTDDQGPMLDDWFLVFVPSTAAGWYEASVYADGTGEIRRELARLLRTEPFEGELATSTDYASHIIWPLSLRGQPLFEFSPVQMPWWRRLMRLGCGQIRIELAPHVKNYVEESST